MRIYLNKDQEKFSPKHNTSEQEAHNRNVKELRKEIAKGWNGPVSKRTIKDIIADKLKAYQQV